MAKEIALVTGAAGFIGSHVVDHLIAKGYKVIAVDDLSGGFEHNINKKAIFEKGSVANSQFINSLFEKYTISYVFHLAAYAAEGLSHFIRRFNYTNNLIGSVNLVNAAVNYSVKHFVFTSSIAVYGANQTPMIETLTPEPEDPYGISKYAMELDLKSAHEMFGLNYTIFRPHNVYGERQNHGDPYRNVLGIFINNIMKNKPMTIFGDGSQTRAFSYIGDVAPYLVESIENTNALNQVFNIGADEPYTILELAETIADAMGVEPNITFLDARNEVVNAYADHTKAKKVFKIKKTTDLKVGVKKMVEWSKKVGPMNPKKFKGIEVTKNMPPSWLKIAK